MKHPAEFFLKYVLLRDPALTDAQLEKMLVDSSMLRMPQGEELYYGFVRAGLNNKPQGFDPTNRTHRPSMQYLREQGVYELFFPTDAVQESWAILTDLEKRMVVEQILLARLDLKTSVARINKKNLWKLTAEGVGTYSHFFWNVKLLSFDEWGRFLYGRASMYERYMGLLQAPPPLAFFHLRLEQVMESKEMIKRAQEIAFFTLEELNQKPGTGTDKVKGISVLTKAINECHASLSTSDMALKDVLTQFEKFRMDHPLARPQSLLELAPKGNFTGSGEVDKGNGKDKPGTN